MWGKIKCWFKKYFEYGDIIDFPNAKECDPNEPLRTIEPHKLKGFKFKWKW